MKKALTWGVLIALCVAIFISSGLSELPMPRRFWASLWIDKVLHVGAYFCLSVLAGVAARLSFTRWNAKACAVFGCVMAGAYGASDEFHQSFTRWRTPDVLDFTADLTGAVIAALLVYVFYRVPRIAPAPVAEPTSPASSENPCP